MMGGMCTELTRALSLLPAVPTVMTSAFENKRSGILVARVMLCAEEPPCVAVAVPKGHRIATLVRDSHAFCLNLIDPKHKLLTRKFENGPDADAFELLDSRTLATGAPCLGRAIGCLDCDVMRHFDLEADHEIYIGQVMAAWLPGFGAPGINGHARLANPLPLNGTSHPRSNGAAASIGLANGAA